MALDLRQYLALQTRQQLQLQQGNLQFINQMVQELPHSDLKTMLQTHGQMIQQLINNLSEVVYKLGAEAPPQQQEHRGFFQQLEKSVSSLTGGQEGTVTQALMALHRNFMENTQPDQRMIFINDAVEADRLKHLEVAGYTSLITIANYLGENEFVTAFQENLKLEQQMCTELEGVLPSLLDQSGQARKAA